MRFIDYLDKGASLGDDAPCLTMDGRDLSYREVQRLSYRVARGLARSGIAAYRRSRHRVVGRLWQDVGSGRFAASRFLGRRRLYGPGGGTSRAADAAWRRLGWKANP